MKANDMRAKSAPELKLELTELLRARFALRMQVATQQSNKTSELGKLKREIARLHTVLHEKARMQ
jgi:large subunit ribosomal protein L29